jgi:alpha-tubulin suppressor-like RCC1 family protein
VSCFGYNAFGQLGAPGPSSALPVVVPGIGNALDVRAGGGSHTCALDGDLAACWGDNNNGQIGNGLVQPSAPPTVVATGVRAVAPGFVHTCSLDSIGAVSCWGSNFSGALGDGSGIDHPIPTPVPSLAAGVTVIASGTLHSCALLGDEDLRCWGENSFGQVGDGTTTSRPTPVPVVF